MIHVTASLMVGGVHGIFECQDSTLKMSVTTCFQTLIFTSFMIIVSFFALWLLYLTQHH